MITLEMSTFIFAFEIIGTIAFAMSGASVAIRNKMDIFGVAVLGTTTAVGGGIIRDLILGVIPPMAFQKSIYALVAVVVSLIDFITVIRKHAVTENVVFLIMDTIGLGVFTVVGVKAGMVYSNTFLSVFVGVLTGVGGGVLRDLFAGTRPYIFVKHFYACASIIGALATAILWKYIGEDISMIVGAVLIIILRLLAAKFHWSLPKA